MDGGFLQTYLFYSWIGLTPQPNSFKLLLNNIFINQSNILRLVVLPMDNTFKKAESIRKAVEAYETDSTLGMRGTVTIYVIEATGACHAETRAVNLVILLRITWYGG
jgi:hypothetical protein